MFANPMRTSYATRDKTYNFSDLLALKKDEPKDEKKELPQFIVNNIIIENGSIDFIDGPFDTTHTVREMNIAIPFVSNIPEYIDTYVQPGLPQQSTAIPMPSRARPRSSRTPTRRSSTSSSRTFDIPFYLAYIPHELNISVPSGKLDVQSTVTFSMSPDKHPVISVAGNVALRDFALQDRKKNAIAGLKRLDVVMTALEPLQSKFHFAKIAIDSPELNVRRDKSGTINLLTLAPPKKRNRNRPRRRRRPKKSPCRF